MDILEAFLIAARPMIIFAIILAAISLISIRIAIAADKELKEWHEGHENTPMDTERVFNLRERHDFADSVARYTIISSYLMFILGVFWGISAVLL